MLNKCKRVYQVGLKNSTIIAAHRLRQWYFATYWRKRITTYQSAPSVLPTTIPKLTFLDRVCSQSDHAQCIEKADEIVAGYLSVLGSPKKKYTHMPWHTDIRLAAQQPSADVHFGAMDFYRDIRIVSGVCGPELSKDIKVPWELSRSQQLPILGHAYMLTKNELYVQKIIEWGVGWIENNSFLYGVNWCNPMEVALRALNWIVALSLIAESSSITRSFVQDITTSLREHLVFIEGNWEWYDGKTSNHYLSDLVGYLYLCWFLGERKKLLWTAAEIKRELDKQVLPDGGDYEGSTRYHRLVAELCAYAYNLIEQEKIECNRPLIKKRKQMDDFLWWCTPHNGTLVTVGDDDSGCVLPFEYSYAMKGSDVVDGDRRTRFFKNFGLSVYKSRKVHVTLRHHAYTQKQPAGHFHNDVGSITLAVDGIPIVVDPGSYVYTPSVYWRNYFRSAYVHNSAYIHGQEPAALTDQLFNLALPLREDNDALFCVQHALYGNGAITFERALDCSDTSIIIRDKWCVPVEYREKTLGWNFTLHPAIKVVPHNEEIMLMYASKRVATIRSAQLRFGIESAFVAPFYGEKKATNCIRAYMPSATMASEISILL